jgi:lambda family phage portal protein
MRRIAIPPETLADKIVRYFDPIRARERMQARVAMAIAGGYAGASTTRRSLSSWITGNRDADGDILYDQDRLRQRSRDLVRNAPIATGAVGLVVNNTVGTGLKLQSRIDREYLRLDDAAADAWETAVEREWSLWADSQECDAARTQQFSDLQALAFRQVLENGDAFAVLPRFRRGLNPYLLKVQLIEADRVTNKNWSANTTTLAGGIQKDLYGAPVAYHVQRQHPGAIIARNLMAWDEVPAFNSKTGLRNVLHLYEVLRPGQSRGVPYLAPVIEALKQLERYTEAELMAAVVSGMFTVFVESDTGGGLPIPSFNPTTETGAQSDDEDYKLGNGSIVGLAPGEKISTANPGRPNQAFDPFISAILRQIGMALGLPYEVLIRHFSSSYSASRAALLEAWRFFRIRRAWLQNHFCQPVYENWLTEAVAFGRIPAPGFFADIRIRQAYCGTIWIGDAPGQIDPMKEVNASEKRISLGLSTLDEETVLLTGGDFERNYPRILKERRLMEAAGMWTPVTASPASPASLPAAESDDEGDADETD